jgi:phosphoesterase RecJ-like protein
MTFSIAGDLINSGIDFPEINRSIYNKRTVGQVKLMSIVTSSLEMYSSNKISMITLDKKTLHKCKCNEDEAEEFVNIARDIEGVEVAIFIKEKGDNLYKVSLRSNNYADVRKIAEAFNGGGHIRAAGCTIQGDINYVKECVISEANKQLDVNV